MQSLLARSLSHTVFMILVIAFAPFSSLSARAESNWEETPQSIELLQAKLKKKTHSTAAKKISKALKALKAKRFAEARGLVGSLKSDPLFADYAYGIPALSFQAQAESEITKKSYDQAIQSANRSIQLFLEIESKFPYSAYLKKLTESIADSELVLGDAYHFKKRESEAQSHFERAFQRLTQANALGQVWPETLEHYAESCAKNIKNVSSLCKSWLLRFTSINAKSSEETKAIVKFFPDILDRAKPPQVVRQTQTYKGMDLDLVAFETAMSQYAEGKYSTAIKSFYRFLDEYPRSTHRHRSRFWMAQALTQEQEHEKAQRTYEDIMRETPLTYYGLLASLSCGKSVDSLIDGTLPEATATDPYLQPAETLRIQRAERLITEGGEEVAQQELRELKARDQLSSSFLLYLATLNHEAGSHNSAFPILGELIQRNYPGVYSSYGLRLIFPATFFDLIQKNTKELNLDPILVLSLMKQESAFDPGANSIVGASGLMQLMPATAVETDPSVKRAELLLPEVNIRIGTRYLKKMMDKYNGNIVFSIAAYNAGPGAVDRWIRESRAKKGMLEFIEQIPYRETREYVSSIIRNYFWYSKRLKGETPKGLSYFWNVYGPPELFKEAPASLSKTET